MRERAVDVGCGNGQLAVQLAAHFGEVVGLDPSADQIANVTAHGRVRSVCAPAENIPLPDGSADLFTAAQAAHWFDLPHLYDEVRRIDPDAISEVAPCACTLHQPNGNRICPSPS